MKNSRNIGGSLLPSSDSRILTPIPFRDGSLQVRPDAENDTHALWFVAAGQETKLAQHPNGYSCRSLAERLLKGEPSRVMDQADYMVRCGGTADVEAIKALVGAPTPSQSKPAAGEAGQTLAAWLDLPSGWIATRYISGTELQAPAPLGGKLPAPLFIPMPYQAMDRAWWIEQARALLATLA